MADGRSSLFSTDLAVEDLLQLSTFEVHRVMTAARLVLLKVMCCDFRIDLMSRTLSLR